jgi:RNA polymerase sigma-70 factor, ECF subfamily
MSGSSQPTQASTVPTAEPSAEPRVGLEALYAEHFDFVWRNLRRLGVGEQQLRDAAQDVFVVVHRRFDEWDGADSVRAWLYSIVRRVAADSRRRRRRKEPLEREDEQSLVDGRDAGPEHNAARSEARSLLLALLAKLDDDKREVLILMDLEDMSAPDVARTLSLNLNTVYSRLRAARLAMREGYALATSEKRSLT